MFCNEKQKIQRLLSLEKALAAHLINDTLCHIYAILLLEHTHLYIESCGWSLVQFYSCISELWVTQLDTHVSSVLVCIEVLIKVIYLRPEQVIDKFVFYFKKKVFSFLLIFHYKGKNKWRVAKQLQQFIFVFNTLLTMPLVLSISKRTHWYCFILVLSCRLHSKTSVIEFKPKQK